jgi:hypothetical protein
MNAVFPFFSTSARSESNCTLVDDESEIKTRFVCGFSFFWKAAG